MVAAIDARKDRRLISMWCVTTPGDKRPYDYEALRARLAARESMRREKPLKSMLMPTSVPMTQTGAGRPGTPDQDGEDEGDDAVDQKPAGTVPRPNLEELDEFDDGLEEEVAGEDEGEGEKRIEGVEDEVDAGEEIDGADEELPDDASGGVGLEGEDKVSDAADDHQPAEEERNADAGEEWDEEGEKAGEDQKDAEGDGPVDGFGGETGRLTGVVFMRGILQKMYIPGRRVGRRIS